jgi:hypothetical protein
MKNTLLLALALAACAARAMPAEAQSLRDRWVENLVGAINMEAWYSTRIINLRLVTDTSNFFKVHPADIYPGGRGWLMTQRTVNEMRNLLADMSENTACAFV